MPKKGRWTQEDSALETVSAFVEARREHAAVESRTNCLEQHARDRMRTKGRRVGFARLVAASVIATNLCHIGTVLIARDRAPEAGRLTASMEGYKRYARNPSEEMPLLILRNRTLRFLDSCYHDIFGTKFILGDAIKPSVPHYRFRT